MLAAGPAWAQRVQFPTMVSPDPAAAGGAAPTNGPPVITGPLTPVPSGTTFDPYATPGAAPAYNVAQAPPYAPQYAAPPPAYSPYSPSPYAPPPSYATPPPYSPTPGALFPDPGPSQANPMFPPGTLFPSFRQPLRLLQGVWLRDTYLFGNGGSQSLMVNDTETSATFAVPIGVTQPPLLITPGFGVHFFGGPSTTPTQPADLPPRTYDAYLDLAWQPRVNEFLSFNLGARAGIYSDFDAVNFHSIRVMGRGLGIVAVTPTLQVAVGAVYIDRNRIKLLPAGGFIWTPNPDTRLEVLFPNPKLAHRWTTLGTTDVWYYIAAEYGGGAWTIKRAFGGGDDDIDYNDIRIMLGLETYGVSRVRAMAETGFVFNRQVLYRSGTPQFDASDTVMVRAGLTY